MATNWDMFDTYNVQEVKNEDGRNNKSISFLDFKLILQLFI